MLEVAVAKALIKLVFPNPFERLDAAKTPDMATPFILAQRLGTKTKKIVTLNDRFKADGTLFPWIDVL